MTDAEIRTFMETMEEFGDEWDYETVKDCYGDDSLEEAIAHRKMSFDFLGDIASAIINR